MGTKQSLIIIMKSAPVQNSSFLATLRLSFSSSFSKGGAVYQDSEVEELHFCALRSLLIMLLISLFTPLYFYAQSPASKIDTLSSVITKSPYEYLTREQKTKRQWFIGGLNVVGYGASIIIFNNTWYKDYPRTSFHTFNDSKEWLQMDKMGHGWAAYNAGRGSAAMWRWAGVEEKKATWIGGLSSTAYLTVIEFLDAHSSKWGWSWSDMAANILGSGLFISQQLGWEEQRIQLKFSFHLKNYSDPMLNERSDDLFGSHWTERMLKDYNGQAYWLSANLRSFFQRANLPKWLNLSIGYGADGMFGGFENTWVDEETGQTIDRTDIKRYRQWYLAPDIDFSKIKTNKKGVKVLLDVLNCFKMPSPALELSNGKLKARAIYF
jgi:hypothetical protein